MLPSVQKRQNDTGNYCSQYRRTRFRLLFSYKCLQNRETDTVISLTNRVNYTSRVESRLNGIKSALSRRYDGI